MPTKESSSIDCPKQRHENDVLSSILSSDFVAYCKAFRGQILLSFVFLLIGYSLKLFGNTFSIDTQSMISVPDSLYQSWYELERYGLIWFKHLTGLYWYNNALASFLTVVLFGFSALLWAYMLSSLSRDCTIQPMFFMIPFVASPVLAEQLGFLLQGPEIAFSIGAVALSLLFTNRLFESNQRRGKIAYGCIAVILAYLAFSMYLAMVTLFITGVAFIAIIRYWDSNLKRQQLLWIAYSIAVFAAGYLLFKATNFCVMKFMHIQVNPYVTEQSRWGKDSINLVIINILRHARDLYLGYGIFYSLFATILLAIFGVIVFTKSCRNGFNVLNVIIAFAICCSPMLMSVILGAAPSVRTEISYALAFSLATAYSCTQISLLSIHGFYSHLCRVATILVVIIIGLNQAYIVNRLFYTESVTYEQDVQLSWEIKTRIDNLGLGESPNIPVIFVGAHTPLRNNDCFRSEQLSLVGRSLYEVTFSVEHGTFVKSQFLATQGINYQLGSSEQYQEAESVSHSMPHWPAQGSVAKHGDIIIVNF